MLFARILYWISNDFWMQLVARCDSKYWVHFLERLIGSGDVVALRHFGIWWASSVRQFFFFRCCCSCVIQKYTFSTPNSNLDGNRYTKYAKVSFSILFCEFGSRKTQTFSSRNIFFSQLKNSLCATAQQQRVCRRKLILHSCEMCAGIYETIHTNIHMEYCHPGKSAPIRQANAEQSAL